MRAITVFSQASKRPIEAIEAIIALTVFLFGLYVVSPFYITDTGSSIGKVFQDNPYQRVLIGLIFFVLPALPLVLGKFLDTFNTATWRKRSTLAMFCGLTFLTLLRIIAVGFTPATWVFSLALAFVSAVCFLYVRERNE